jgi:hypothetical protein
MVPASSCQRLASRRATTTTSSIWRFNRRSNDVSGGHSRCSRPRACGRRMVRPSSSCRADPRTVRKHFSWPLPGSYKAASGGFSWPLSRMERDGSGSPPPSGRPARAMGRTRHAEEQPGHVLQPLVLGHPHGAAGHDVGDACRPHAARYAAAAKWAVSTGLPWLTTHRRMSPSLTTPSSRQSDIPDVRHLLRRKGAPEAARCRSLVGATAQPAAGRRTAGSSGRTSGGGGDCHPGGAVISLGRDAAGLSQVA